MCTWCWLAKSCLFRIAWTAACQASLSFTISLSLLKLKSIEFMMPSILFSVTPFSSCLQSFPTSGSFPMSQLFTSGDKSIGASVLVLPMNIQGSFPLWLIGLISLLSKGLSRVFFSTTVWKHQFFVISLLSGPTLTPVPDYQKSHSFDCKESLSEKWSLWFSIHCLSLS